MRKILSFFAIFLFSGAVQALPDVFEDDIEERRLIDYVERSIAYLVSDMDYHPYQLEKYAKKRRMMAEMIVTACRTNNVPALLVTPMVYLESRFYPSAIGKKGEIGLMQVHGVAARNCELKTPMGQLLCGTRYLRKLIDKSCDSSLEMAVSAYVSGQCIAYGKIVPVVQLRLGYYENLRELFLGEKNIFISSDLLIETEAQYQFSTAVDSQRQVDPTEEKPDYMLVVKKAYEEFLSACSAKKCPQNMRCIAEDGEGKCVPF